MRFFSFEHVPRWLHVIVFFGIFTGLPNQTHAQSELIASTHHSHTKHRLSDDGRYLLYTSWEDNLEILWRIPTYGQKTPVKLSLANATGYGSIRSFAISPDGKTVAYVAVSADAPVNGSASPIDKYEQLFSAPLDGLSPPVLLAEADIKLIQIPAVPANNSQPPVPASEKINIPFDTHYSFSDDSQYLLYTLAEGFSVEWPNDTIRRSKITVGGPLQVPVQRVFRVQISNPHQTIVDITPVIKPTLQAPAVSQYGFVPLSHNVYISYKRYEPVFISAQGRPNEQQLFVVDIDESLALKPVFSTINDYQQFVPDGKRLLLVSPDDSGAKQLYVYNLSTGSKIRLSTATTHLGNASYPTDFYSLPVKLYGDWVLYYPQGAAERFFSSRLAKVPCFITHLNHPELDRKISDNCNKARISMAQQSIYYDTFEVNSGEEPYPSQNPYYLMRQPLKAGHPIARLGEGHWKPGFEFTEVYGYQLAPDRRWASRSHSVNSIQQVQWLNLNDHKESFNWNPYLNQDQDPLSGSYPRFTRDGMRLLTPDPKHIAEPVPAALEKIYDSLSLPRFDIQTGQQLTHIPMPDNCRVFSQIRGESRQYFMTECDRPWTELW